MSQRRLAIYSLVATAASLTAALVVNFACASPEEDCLVAVPSTCGTDTCVDLLTDPEHCGSCTFSCGGGECVAGVCRCGGVSCQAGELCCGTACSNLRTDTAHCGRCDIACASGEACTSGVCGGSACPGGCTGGLTCCGRGCVDTRTDRNNCGACGTVCTSTQACESGRCLTSECSPPCTSPERCCGAACVDVSTDIGNCGFCGNRCGEEDPPLSDGCMASGSSAVCSCRGARECMPGQACCSDGCRNLQVDTRNCGACGNACPDGMRCTAGVCSCGDTGGPCPDGEACCDNACVDISSDIANCGGCRNACNAERADSCVEGVCKCGSSGQCAAGAIFMCGAATPAGYPQRCCSGACIQVGDDACASCTEPCGADTTCLTTPLPMMPPCRFSCQASGTGDAGP